MIDFNALSKLQTKSPHIDQIRFLKKLCIATSSLFLVLSNHIYKSLICSSIRAILFVSDESKAKRSLSYTLAKKGFQKVYNKGDQEDLRGIKK